MEDILNALIFFAFLLCFYFFQVMSPFLLFIVQRETSLLNLSVFHLVEKTYKDGGHPNFHTCYGKTKNIFSDAVL